MKQVIASLLFIGLAYSQSFNYTMGTTLYPMGTPAKPAKGASITEANFGTTITRVTAASESGSWGVGTGYSTWSPKSSDGAYLMLYGLSSLTASSGYLLYNASTFAFVRQLPFGWYNSQDPEPRWDTSGSHPTWIYYRKDKQLRYYDVATSADALVRDFASDFSSYGSTYYIYNGEEGISSSDSRYWAFMIRNSASSYQTVRVFVYDKTTNTIVASKDVTGHDPNSVSMSPSGNYVYVAYDWTGNGGEFDGPHAYNRTMTSNVKISSGIPHLSFGWTAQGNEVAVFMDSDNVSMVRLDTGTKINLYYQGDLGWSDSNLLHAYVGPAKKGWGFISTYSTVNTSWDYNQIFAIELDETKAYGGATLPRIWRIASTQNAVGTSYYYEQPNAQLDPEGTRIWFGSNWRSDGASPDVYQVTLPANWWSDLGGTGGGGGTTPPAGQTATYTWDLSSVANGTYTLTAVARDAAGNRATSAPVTVTIARDRTAPTVAISAPAAGASVSGTVSVTASASDNVGVVGVQFFLDGAALGSEVTAAPYSVQWNTTTATAGAHSLTARARDKAGNATTSAAVSVTVANDASAPTVSITAPASGLTVEGDTLLIALTASDNVAVVGLQVMLNGSALGPEITVFQ